MGKPDSGTHSMTASGCGEGTGVTGRRNALLAIGSAFAVGLAGCAQPGNETTQTTGTGTGTGTDTTTGRETTAAPAADTATVSQLQQQLDSVRDATSKYADPKTAMADGYRLLGPYVPGMGWHLLHPERLERATTEGFDIETPPLLTYLETENGLTLGAAEFAAPADAAPANPDLFADEDTTAMARATETGTETWHTHTTATHVFAMPDDRQTASQDVTFDALTTNDNWSEFRPPDESLSAGDTISLNWGSVEGKTGDRTERVVDRVTTHPDLRTLHVWVHTENPAGVFTSINSDFVENSTGHHGADSGGHHGTDTTGHHGSAGGG